MILILCGKSGCGKDTVLQYLTEHGLIKPIISITSRPIRDGELNGREYHFVTKEQFLSLIDKNELLEYRSYDTTVAGNPDTWYYGSPTVDPTSANYGVILDIQGAESYINKYGKDKCRVIMLTVPDAVREERAKLRGGFDQAEWNRRLKDDAEKFSKEKTAGIVDTIIENTGTKDDIYDKIASLM